MQFQVHLVGVVDSAAATVVEVGEEEEEGLVIVEDLVIVAAVVVAVAASVLEVDGAVPQVVVVPDEADAEEFVAVEHVSL